MASLDHIELIKFVHFSNLCENGQRDSAIGSEYGYKEYCNFTLIMIISYTLPYFNFTDILLYRMNLEYM